MMKSDLAIFEEHQIRRIYDEETEGWFFSVMDIVQLLTSQLRACRQLDRVYFAQGWILTNPHEF